VPVSAHDRQFPVHAVLQQTPWAQKPLLHSLPAPHAAPSGLRPQLDSAAQERQRDSTRDLPAMLGRAGFSRE